MKKIQFAEEMNQNQQPETQTKDLFIEQYAFQNCISLKNFTMPQRLKQFDSKCFDGCRNLEAVIVDTTHKNYWSSMGRIYKYNNITFNDK